MNALLIFVISAIVTSTLYSSEKRVFQKKACLDAPEIAQLRITLKELYSDLAELEALKIKESLIEKTLDQCLFQASTAGTQKFLH